MPASLQLFGRAVDDRPVEVPEPLGATPLQVLLIAVVGALLPRARQLVQPPVLALARDAVEDLPLVARVGRLRPARVDAVEGLNNGSRADEAGTDLAQRGPKLKDFVLVQGLVHLENAPQPGDGLRCLVEHEHRCLGLLQRPVEGRFGQRTAQLDVVLVVGVHTNPEVCLATNPLIPADPLYGSHEIAKTLRPIVTAEEITPLLLPVGYRFNPTAGVVLFDDLFQNKIANLMLGALSPLD
mmetsp:Transcript_92479/g.275840  ORF Transcript_92479/g.275840 Transcript_92479/m.275840 type:complete len:240 (-) Transcript_92479:281-1000(-)